MTSIVANLYET